MTIISLKRGTKESYSKLICNNTVFLIQKGRNVLAFINPFLGFILIVGIFNHLATLEYGCEEHLRAVTQLRVRGDAADIARGSRANFGELRDAEQVITNTVAPHDSEPSITEQVMPIARTAYKSELNDATTLAAPSKYMHIYLRDEDIASQVFLDLWKGDMCQELHMNPNEDPPVPTLIHVKFSCQATFKSSSIGTGNFLIVFYTLRLLARAHGNTDVLIQCSDAEETKASLVLPWVTGKFEPSPGPTPPREKACNYLGFVGYLIEDLILEMRRMAVSLLGIPSSEHPSASWTKDNLWASTSKDIHRYDVPALQENGTAIFPNMELDDAVLHFRCGDLMESDRTDYGFMKFVSYARHLSPDVRSVGILTEPFRAIRVTELGKPTRQMRCKKVVDSFVEYLKEQFPEAVVSIRNNDEETVALSYARIVMANQTVIGMSTFGTFPALATFGKSYVLHATTPYQPNAWINYDKSNTGFLRNTELINEPTMSAAECNEKWGEDGSWVIEWFQNKTKDVSD